MSGARSRRKGIRFERAVAQRLRETLPGVQVRRGIQSRCGSDAPDVDLPGFWVEVKHHRRVDLRAALAQAIADAAADRIPVAICKDNRSEPVVVLRLDDFLTFLESHTAPSTGTRSLETSS